MPYIVTHGYRPPGPGASLEPHSRTAVATLDEARDVAHTTIHAAYRAAYPLQPCGLGGEHSDAQRAHRWHNVDVEKLPDSGGTVGPLPDGTVIEVRRLEWIELARRCEMDCGSLCAGPNSDVLAAFNARNRKDPK